MDGLHVCLAAGGVASEAQQKEMRPDIQRDDSGAADPRRFSGRFPQVPTGSHRSSSSRTVPPARGAAPATTVAPPCRPRRPGGKPFVEQRPQSLRAPVGGALFIEGLGCCQKD